MFSSAIAVGDENNNSESTQSSTTTLEKRKPDVPNGPRVPSRVYIECSYGVGYVEFTFPVECEYMEVTLEQNGVQVYYGVVTPEEPCAEIPLLSGECTVTCHTDGNQTYSGVLFF
ncbi:MAG: hypothetical protein ACI30M_02835 [Muribaculaceae bacterium]